jgi:hypothetical protein
MSIASELRLRRRGQLAKLQDERDRFEHDADEAVFVILLKCDHIAAESGKTHTLDTEAILRAAEKLNDNVRALKGIDKQIETINEELYG